MGPPNFALTKEFSWDEFCDSQWKQDEEEEEELLSWSSSSSSSSSGALYPDYVGDDDTVRIFLESLNLSRVHPLCLRRRRQQEQQQEQQQEEGQGQEQHGTTSHDDDDDDDDEYARLSIPPPMGPLVVHDYHENVPDVLLTVWKQSTPTILAMSELWLRFFAAALAPFGIAYMIRIVLLLLHRRHRRHRHRHHRHSSSSSSSSSSSTSNGATKTTSTKTATTETTKNGTEEEEETEEQEEEQEDDQEREQEREREHDDVNLGWTWKVVSLLSVASSVVLATDPLYVYEYGPERGISFLLASSVLTTFVLFFPVLPFGDTTTKPTTRTTTTGQPRRRHRHRQGPFFFCRCYPTLLMFVLIWTIFLFGTSIPRSARHHDDEDDDGAGGGDAGAGRTRKVTSRHDDLLPHNIPEGIYYNRHNDVIRRAVEGMMMMTTTTTKTKTKTDPLVDSTSASSTIGTNYSYETGMTPWLPTGDSRTGIPFLLNFWPSLPRLERVWQPTSDENGNEAVRLEFSFPTRPVEQGKDEQDGRRRRSSSPPPPPRRRRYHDASKTLYLVLHGLNGGSQEEFVKDFVHRRNHEGHTVVIMVARGLMDTPVRGWTSFHGARTIDVHSTATSLRRAIRKQQQQLLRLSHSHPSSSSSSSSSQPPKQQPQQQLAAVGYSMGAIIVSNYVSHYCGADLAKGGDQKGGEAEEEGRGDQSSSSSSSTSTSTTCPLDAAVAVSGGLDMRYQIGFRRAKRLWEPMLAFTLREQFILGKSGERFRARLSKVQMRELMRATDVSGIDLHAVVTYNSYDNLTHYYADMSAMGDLPCRSCDDDDDDDDEDREEDDPSRGRLASLSVPLCVLFSLDDPLLTWKTVAANRGYRHPANLTKSIPNLVLWLTKRGGHVGWPLGWNPLAHRWRFMNDAAHHFVQSVRSASSSSSSSSS